MPPTFLPFHITVALCINLAQAAVVLNCPLLLLLLASGHRAWILGCLLPLPWVSGSCRCGHWCSALEART